MNNTNRNKQRQTRIRKKVALVSDRPRLSVFRSNAYVYAQIIDKKGDTILGLSEKTLKVKGTPIERAKLVGAEIAKMALEKKIKEVAFDKGRFAYHGRIKAIAEGAREGGLSL
jgi:large subunit ribosomal protein L18